MKTLFATAVACILLALATGFFAGVEWQAKKSQEVHASPTPTAP